MESYEGDGFIVEVSYNERARDDRVYFFFEDFNGETIETYISLGDYRSMLKALMRLDEATGILR